jgi:hypothetical protein
VGKCILKPTRADGGGRSAPKTDPRDHPRFLAQPLRRLCRVTFYGNQSVLSVLNICRVGRSTGRTSVEAPVDRPAQKTPDQQKGTALHWVRVGSSICVVILRPDNLFRDVRRSTGSSSGSLFFNFSWSDRFSQRVAGPRASARSFRRMLLRA